MDKVRCERCQKEISGGSAYNEENKEWVHYCGTCAACYDIVVKRMEKARTLIKKLLRVGRFYSPEYAWELLVDEADTALSDEVEA